MEPSKLSDDGWSQELDEVICRLQPFLDCLPGRDRKTQDLVGNQAQIDLYLLHYFWSGAVCNGNVFGMLWLIRENRSAFERIGAKGCLAAMDRLLPFWEEQQRLETTAEKERYWLRTKAEREDAESLTEDCVKFGQMLLEFAREHEDQICGV